MPNFVLHFLLGLQSKGQEVEQLYNVICFIVGIEGIIQIIKNMKAIGLSKKVAKWAQSDAEVVSCSLLEKKNEKSDIILQKIIIKYEYVYNNKTYTGSSLFPNYTGSADNIKFDCNTTLFEKLETAKRVTAYINPKDPNEAFLIPNESGNSGKKAIKGFLLLLLSCIVWFMFQRAMFGTRNYSDALTVHSYSQHVNTDPYSGSNKS